MMVRFHMMLVIAISYVRVLQVQASSYYGVATTTTTTRSNKNDNDNVSTNTIKRDNIIDIDLKTLPSQQQRRLQQQQEGLGLLFQSLSLVSDTCRNGMEVLYESSDLQAAYNAFAAAEQIAFQRSCDDVPRDDGGLTATYDCDVQINPSSLIDDFERTCVAAGGSVQDFGGTPVGIECCGTGTNNNGAGGGQLFLTYGYHTLDQRSCVAASTCTEQEASRFYQQGMFMEATNVFQEELGLVCGAGCGVKCGGGVRDEMCGARADAGGNQR